MAELQLGNIIVDVEQKDIKHIHLSVYPPNGRVKIAAPSHLSLEMIRIYVISKLSWIKKQQKKVRNQKRDAPREYLNRESHYYKGKRYLLRIIEIDRPPRVDLKHGTIDLYVRPGSTLLQKQALLDEWYRTQLKTILPDMITQWEKTLKVKVDEFRVKKMKTKWGTCTREAGRIWINLELAKKTVDCLEYIVVHEMMHLLERRHNDKFIAYMDFYLPKWKFYKEMLNRLPVKHEDWNY